MQELNARAVLVPATSVEDGLSTAVTRDQVADALAAGGPIELILDVARFEPVTAPPETHSVAVSWQRADLERLLHEGPGDAIQLTFDRQAIEEAVGDVEGHGLRERVLVLAVAATAAVGTAGAANAAPMLDQTSPTGASYVVDRSAVSDFSSAGVSGETAKTPATVPDGGASLSSPAVAGEAAKAPAPDPVPARTVDDGGISLEAPGSAAVIAGGIALAITAAAFAAGGRRRVTPA